MSAIQSLQKEMASSMISRPLRVDMEDGRIVIGRFDCLDSYGNILLSGAEEFTPVKRYDVEQKMGVGGMMQWLLEDDDEIEIDHVNTGNTTNNNSTGNRESGEIADTALKTSLLSLESNSIPQQSKAASAGENRPPTPTLRVNSEDNSKYLWRRVGLVMVPAEKILRVYAKQEINLDMFTSSYETYGVM